MASRNPWYPADEPSWQPRTRDWAKQTTEYVWTLRDQQANLAQTFQNFNNNLAEQVTMIINGGNNNGIPIIVTKPPVVFGSHALRLTSAYSPPSWNGYIFVETDRFQAAYYSNGTQWVLVEGVGYGAFESRYANLNSFDTGMDWIETSHNNINSTSPYLVYRWDGNNWGTVSGIGRGTHSQRMNNWPSVYFSPGTQFQETDRGNVIYQTQNATGVCNTNGTAVTWVSGNHFVNSGNGFNANQYPANTAITIGNNTFLISSASNQNAITLTSSAGVHNNQNFTIISGQWQYLSGRWPDMSGLLPTDLGEADYYVVDANNNVTRGFEFFDQTHWRLFEWAKQGGEPGNASPGWTRGEGEVPTATLMILPFGPGNTGGINTGWSLCNGGNVSITQDDATTTAFTTPPFANGYFPKGITAANYTGNGTNATPPTISGNTEPTSLSLTGANSGSVDAGNGAPASFLTDTGSIDPNPHSHALDSNNATISLPGDPVPWIGVPFYVKR
jgi:hypothetical protein